MTFKKREIDNFNVSYYMEDNYMNIFDQVVYQVFIRDFTKEGTFKAAETKLEYIKSLGVTIIQLMPFHPIGVKGRKGTYGSPYAI